MSASHSSSPDLQLVHQYGQFESSQLSNTFLDGLRPLAESSAIKPPNPKGNATYSIVKDRPSLSPSASLDILNLDSLSNKLLSLSAPDATVEGRDVAFRCPEEDKNDPDMIGFRLNADELRHLEEAFSDLSTGPKDTGAIATMTLEKADGSPISQSPGQATNASSLPSLSSDIINNQIAPSPTTEEYNTVVVCEDQENQPPVGASGDVRVRDLHSNSLSEAYFYGRPLSTIVEWQSRESFSSTTAYQGKSQMNEKAAEAFGVHDDLVLCVSVFDTIVPLASPQPFNDSRTILSAPLAANERSDIFEEGKNINSCRPPAHLVSPPISPAKYTGRSILADHSSTSNAGRSTCQGEPKNNGEDTQYSFEYGQMAYHLPGVGYWYVNEVSRPMNGDKAIESKASPIPASRTSLLSSSVWVPPLDLSDLTQAAPSTTTITTAPPASNLSSHSIRGGLMVPKPSSSSDEMVEKDVVAESSGGTHAIATQTISQESNSIIKDKNMKTTCEVELNSSAVFATATSLEVPPKPSDDVRMCTYDEGRQNLFNVGNSDGSTALPNSRNKYPLMATSRCLFWRACTYGHESKQVFILRQDSDHLMRVKLQITKGREFFTLLDHRGLTTQKGSRVIELPPRDWPARSDTNTRCVSSRCYVQRLIGYVGGSGIQCDFCRGVDEKTYWTSAFSTPTEADKPLQMKSSYYARVSIINVGLRTVWVFAVAMAPNSCNSSSLIPLSGVRVRPTRFVLRPSQSRDVIISIAGEPLEVQVLFYNGDEILRYQCRKMLAATGQPEQSPPRTLPRPHHRLRSAYVMRPFDGESQDMSGEMSLSVSEGHYNWHGALQDEQRSRAPLSLTIYPLLTEASTSSFEASSSLIIGHHMEEDFYQLTNENARFSTSLETTGQVQWPSGDTDAPLDHSTFLPVGNPAFVRPSQHERSMLPPSPVTALPYEDIPIYRSTCLDPPSQPSKVPLVTLRPDSQLIFAPCRPGLFTSATLQIELGALDSSRSEEGSGSLTSSTISRRRLSSLWRLYWRAKPVQVEGMENVFSYLVSPRPLLVEPGETHHLPFSFRPPRGAPPDTRFSQRWLFSFRLSRDVTGPLILDTTLNKPTQETEILFVGDTLSEPHQSSTPGPKTVIVKSLLKLRGVPVIFKRDCQQCQFDLINTSFNERLTVAVGQIDSPAFELIRPTSKKFSVEPRSSVRLTVQRRLGDALKNAKETTALLPLWWSSEADKTIKYEKSIPLKAIS
ncbi:hypothetical protein TcWFU_009397 [Taenia crassiceps]|uniref:Cep192-like domain-containing protein n=1 Tax=Taenia crassiceps TaxID=6207 RepID=A0ABR4QIT3_9CEST